MRVSRRTFVKIGVSAFTLGFAAPAFLTDLARAQQANRNLGVLYLGGGNDALSFLVPYTDGAYYSRRPTQAVPAGSVLQIGSDAGGVQLGLHPNLTGLKTMFDDGNLALIQRTGYENASRSHFLGTDIWSTADPEQPYGTGWLGRYLDTLPSPVDPLFAWNTEFMLPRTFFSSSVGVPSIEDSEDYAFFSPSGEDEARDTATTLASHLPVSDPHLSFVNSTTLAAMATLDRVATVAAYAPTAAYPDTGLGAALQAVAGAIATEVGTQIFWVQASGYDIHASQQTTNGTYAGLLTELNDAALAFYTDLRNHRLLESTLVLQFSEFGRRVSENGSQGTDHGAGGLMMAVGGAVAGGLYGTAAQSLAATDDNPDLENNGRDVRHETDFRSVYAQVIDDWLGTDSVPSLGGDFRSGSVDFV